MARQALRFTIWAQIEVAYIEEGGDENDPDYEDLKGAWPAKVGNYETLEEANAALQALDEDHSDGVQVELTEEYVNAGL